MLKVNEYFGGKVKPIAFRTATLPDAEAWRTFGEGETSVAATGREFQLRVAADAAYLYLRGGTAVTPYRHGFLVSPRHRPAPPRAIQKPHRLDAPD